MTDNELKTHMINVMNSNIGFEFNLFDDISLIQLEDLRWALYNRDYARHLITTHIHLCDETIYDDVEFAVDEFLMYRRQMQLGYDFEVELNQPNNNWHEEGF